MRAKQQEWFPDWESRLQAAQKYILFPKTAQCLDCFQIIPDYLVVSSAFYLGFLPLLSLFLVPAVPPSLLHLFATVAQSSLWVSTGESVAALLSLRPHDA